MTGAEGGIRYASSRWRKKPPPMEGKDKPMEDGLEVPYLSVTFTHNPQNKLDQTTPYFEFSTFLFAVSCLNGCLTLKS